MSPEEYFGFLGTLNESIIVYTRDKVVWANQKVSNMMKYDSPEAIIGTSPFNHVHPDLLIDFRKNVETRSEAALPTSGLWKLRCKDGSYKTIQSNGSVYVHDGESYLISIFRAPAHPIEHRYSTSQLQHDLLTPLTVARGFLDILLDKCKNSEDKKYLDAMSESCLKMEETIRALVESLEQQNLLSVTERDEN